MTQTTAQPPTVAPTDATVGHTRHDHDRHTITIPLDSVAHAAQKAVTLPVTAAQRILPAKGGLPLYAGLGALALAGALEWPVAAGIGIGYAVLRRGGAFPPPPPAPQTPAEAIDKPTSPPPGAD
ncbi:MULTISPECIES: hypothetical protein [Streptomyces]|uniref:SpdD protein n=1 Tax=Streptomyces canarius TaxID=285453 RepID=A0ABQ3CIG3_9ACTN|nr:hypothetical protein [Streptomyces canarius]GHA15305.1 hypothetical protein GCM10010345_19920 [Streptomyces canarius]